MIAPRLLYSCDHNLIEYGEAKRTVAVTRDVVSVIEIPAEEEDETGSFTYTEGLSDLVTIPGVFKRVERIYSFGSAENVKPYEMQPSDINTIFYYEHTDFEIESESGSNIFTINWKQKEKLPISNKTYYIDVVYDVKCDIEYSTEELTFFHTINSDRITDIDPSIIVMYIKSNNGRYYYLGKDFNYAIEHNISKNQYDIIIYWQRQVSSMQMSLSYYKENFTTENDLSKGLIIDNEDENKRVTLIAQEDRVCPRCNGTGWYIGLFEKDFHRAKFTNRLIQEFLKFLYTTPSSDGLYLLNIIGSSNIESKEWVKSIIESVVQNCVKRYADMTTEAESNGKTIPDSERLYSAGVSDVEITEDCTGITAKITILTYAGQTLSVPVDIN